MSEADRELEAELFGAPSDEDDRGPGSARSQSGSLSAREQEGRRARIAMLEQKLKILKELIDIHQAKKDAAKKAAEKKTAVEPVVDKKGKVNAQADGQGVRVRQDTTIRGIDPDAEWVAPPRPSMPPPPNPRKKDSNGWRGAVTEVGISEESKGRVAEPRASGAATEAPGFVAPRRLAACQRQQPSRGHSGARS